MLYLLVSLSRSRLCHAWCPPWVCACVVTSVPPRVCLDVTICDIHFYGISVLAIHLSSLRATLICLLCAALLAFLVSMLSLHACLHVHAWVCVSFILQSNGAMDIRSKPTFVLLGHPLLFDNMLLYPFHVLHMFVCSCLASLLACSLHALPISFVCFFACPLACFFGHCMYTHGVRTLGARAQLSRHE